MAEDKGHIAINNVAYVVDLRSYKRRDIVDFSPRVTVAGASVYNELGLYQTLTFDDWQGGFGFPWHTATKTNVYLKTEGQVDTRHAGIAQLFTKPTKSSSDIRADGFITFAGDVWAYSSDNVQRYTSSAGTWAVANSDGSNDLWHNGRYIFSARQSNTLIYGGTDANASTDWTESGATTDQQNFAWFQHHDGYVYAGSILGADQSSGHYVSYDNSQDLSDIYSVSSDDPNIIPVGLNGMQVDKPISFRGDLLFPRPDGIYRLDKDRTAARRVIDYADQTSTDNFRDWAEHNGQLVFPVRDSLISWNGTRTVPITPPKLTDIPPYITYGRFNHFVTEGDWLFLVGRTNESTYEEHILCFDGVGWHKLVEPVRDGTSYVNAMAYDPDNDYLWYAVDAGDGTQEIYYVQFQALSSFPFENFPTGTTDPTSPHSLIFPRVAAGYRRVTKSSPSLLMEGYNLSTGVFLELYYRNDGSTAWLAWGGDSGESNVHTSDGVKEFINPEGEDQSTVEFKYIQYRVDLWSENSTDTPILEGVYPRLLMRPNSLYGWSFNIKASHDPEHGVGKTDETVSEIIDNLKTARDSYAPVDFQDIYGRQYKVYVSAINEQAVEEHVGRAGPEPDVEQIIQVNLVQVG